MKRLFTAFISLLIATSTAAAETALVTTDLNLRRSPDTRFLPVTVLPAGALVSVSGCVGSYRWCRVNWHGYNGWAYSRYLARREYGGYYNGYNDYAATIGIPIIAGLIIGSALSYHGPYYGHRYYGGYYRPGYHGRYYRPGYYGRNYNYYRPRYRPGGYQAPNSHEPGDLW